MVYLAVCLKYLLNLFFGYVLMEPFYQFFQVYMGKFYIRKNNVLK